MFFSIRKIKKSKAQVTSEYAILGAIIIAVLAGMQVYLKRGIQARLKDASDYPVKSGVFQTTHYEPWYQASNRTDVRSSTSRESMGPDIAITRTTTESLDSDISTVIGN